MLSTVGSSARRGGRHLAPGALGRILVRPEANQLRAVAEAVALHLVVAHLRDELVAQRRLLQAVGAPAVRLREAAFGTLVEQRQDERRDLVVVAGADRGRADVV